MRHLLPAIFLLPACRLLLPKDAREGQGGDAGAGNGGAGGVDAGGGGAGGGGAGDGGGAGPVDDDDDGYSDDVVCDGQVDCHNADMVDNCVPFVPTVYDAEFADGIVDGELVEATLDGEPLPNRAILFLADADVVYEDEACLRLDEPTFGT
jgi:hypothetical protein